MRKRYRQLLPFYLIRSLYQEMGLCMPPGGICGAARQRVRVDS